MSNSRRFYNFGDVVGRAALVGRARNSRVVFPGRAPIGPDLRRFFSAVNALPPRQSSYCRGIGVSIPSAIPRKGSSEQLVARVAGHAHAQSAAHAAGPGPLHIGGSNLKSRATSDSPVPPRSHTDVPSPCGQLTCRICPDNSYRLQADAVRGCNLARIAVITVVTRTHARATGGGVSDACLLLPAGRVHPVCMRMA